MTEELRNELIENLLQVLGIKFFRNFDTHLRSLLVQDELYAEGKFANIPNQKKLFIADEIQRSAVTALVAAADKNQLLISEVGSGKNIVETISTKGFNIAVYRKGCGTSLSSKYKQLLAQGNTILELTESNDLFKEELIAESNISEMLSKIFLLIGVFGKNTASDISDIECSIDIPTSNGKVIMESIPFADIFAYKQSKSITIHKKKANDTLVLKLKKVLEESIVEGNKKASSS
uniref:hypothetical protein n=1 Tax=uncultured Acinetobacter sp. TaxID=165433 RepID=UPI00261009E1|nr:hypothetical protein [uncultured Acinetobacter sp.]